MKKTFFVSVIYGLILSSCASIDKNVAREPQQVGEVGKGALKQTFTEDSLFEMPIKNGGLLLNELGGTTTQGFLAANSYATTKPGLQLKFTAFESDFEEGSGDEMGYRLISFYASNTLFLNLEKIKDSKGNTLSKLIGSFISGTATSQTFCSTINQEYNGKKHLAFSVCKLLITGQYRLKTSSLVVDYIHVKDLNTKLNYIADTIIHPIVD